MNTGDCHGTIVTLYRCCLKRVPNLYPSSPFCSCTAGQGPALYSASSSLLSARTGSSSAPLPPDPTAASSPSGFCLLFLRPEPSCMANHAGVYLQAAPQKLGRRKGGVSSGCRATFFINLSPQPSVHGTKRYATDRVRPHFYLAGHQTLATSSSATPGAAASADRPSAEAASGVRLAERTRAAITRAVCEGRAGHSDDYGGACVL